MTKKNEKVDEAKNKIIEGLLEFSLGMINGEDGTELINKYQSALENITPDIMLEMEKRQLEQGISPKIIKQSIEKVINVIFSYLKEYEWQKPQEGHPLYYLMQENRELEIILAKLKKAMIAKKFPETKELLAKLTEIDTHYVRKENILFPYVERIWENYQPLQVMWSLHDDIRSKWKILQKLTEENNDFTLEINKEIGELFFLMYGMIAKEELIVYPRAMETIKADETWEKMQKQSDEMGYSYIKTPESKSTTSAPGQLSDLFWKVETGELTYKQIELLLNHLPLDITFVDENDEVRYFSRPADRFFPRSPAIIGRKVHNCHPPESVHIVEKIIAEFKAGTKKEATFWLRMRGKFVLIRYYAMHDDAGNYRGVLEVGQDITEISQLTGESRLLDWE